MTIKNRIAQLEKQSNERGNRPQVVEIYGTREDGTTYRIETWREFTEADDIQPREVWERFINAGGESHEQP